MNVLVVDVGGTSVTARKNASYITVAVKKDPLDQKVLKCAHALGEIAASGEFQDNGSCH